MNTTASSSFINPTLTSDLNPSLLQAAMELIEPAQRIALLAHEHPDGDCLGSAFGFAHILEQLGKICTVACADPAPRDFSFIPGIASLQQTLGEVGHEPFDLVIALDAGELSRYGSLYERHHDFLDTITILNIDHHVSSHGCGRVSIIDPTAAATAELLVLFQQQARLPLTKDAALCLLTGLITDTASFQFTSTTPRTMETAAVLLRAGAVAETIVRPIFRTRTLAHMRFQAAVIRNVQTACDGRIIWSYATEQTLQEANALAEMDDNFSGMLRDIEGVQISAFFKSYGEPGVTRLSLRTAAPYDAAAICLRLGGGGHARAAGATLYHPLDEAMSLVIEELQREVQAQDAKR